MRINEITNSTEKLELLRMIDAAIWQSFDAESAYGGAFKQTTPKSHRIYFNAIAGVALNRFRTS